MYLQKTWTYVNGGAICDGGEDPNTNSELELRRAFEGGGG